MSALKILDLSYTSINVLPESISNVECLTVLLLAYCKSLCHIPSLAKLRKLRRLDLAPTAITQVPLGFENLTNLRWLHLGRTAVMKAQDLERLQMLESIAATFVDRDEFTACVQIIDARINSGLMKGYRLRLLGDDVDAHLDYIIKCRIDDVETVDIRSVEHATLLLPTAIDLLKIAHCNQWKSLCDVFSIRQMNELHISSFLVQCRDMLEYLFCSSDDCILWSSLQGLNELYLHELDSLNMLCKENQMASSFLPFSHLKKQSIWGCKGIKKLLTPGMSTQLHNLEEISVRFFNSMEEIFSTRGSANYHELSFRNELCILLDIEPYELVMDHTSVEALNELCLLLEIGPYEVDMNHTNVEAIHLPNLKSVSLWSLPQLDSVCEGIIICSSLQKFDISETKMHPLKTAAF